MFHDLCPPVRRFFLMYLINKDETEHTGQVRQHTHLCAVYDHSQVNKGQNRKRSRFTWFYLRNTSSGLECCRRTKATCGFALTVLHRYCRTPEILTDLMFFSSSFYNKLFQDMTADRAQTKVDCCQMKIILLSKHLNAVFKPFVLLSISQQQLAVAVPVPAGVFQRLYLHEL